MSVAEDGYGNPVFLEPGFARPLDGELFQGPGQLGFGVDHASLVFLSGP